MFLFIRKVVALLILKMSNLVVRFLLAVIPVTVQVSTIRITKATRGGVRYRAVFGKWEVQYTMNDLGFSLSLSNQLDTMPTTGASSLSTETTLAGTEQLQLDVSSSDDLIGRSLGYSELRHSRLSSDWSTNDVH